MVLQIFKCAYYKKEHREQNTTGMATEHSLRWRLNQKMPE